jgi:hypothetical protein
MGKYDFKDDVGIIGSSRPARDSRELKKDLYNKVISRLAWAHTVFFV